MHRKRLAMYIIGRMEKATGFNTHPPPSSVSSGEGERPPLSLWKKGVTTTNEKKKRR
jgi:hypothetical protein